MSYDVYFCDPVSREVIELEDEVNRNMKEGYFPIGGIVVTADGKLIQALTVFPTVCPC